MPKCIVPLTSWANIAVTVETDSTDPEEIVGLAQEAVNVSLCHQCAGSSNDSLEVGDEWNAVEVEGKHLFTKLSD